MGQKGRKETLTLHVDMRCDRTRGKSRRYEKYHENKNPLSEMPSAGRLLRSQTQQTLRKENISHCNIYNSTKIKYLQVNLTRPVRDLDAGNYSAFGERFKETEVNQSLWRAYRFEKLSLIKM